jgi:hypothetical protein
MNKLIICLKCNRQTETVKDDYGEQLSKEGKGTHKVMCCKYPDCDNNLFDKGFKSQKALF